MSIDDAFSNKEQEEALKKFWEGEAKDLGDAVFFPLMKESMKPRAKYSFGVNSDAMEPDAVNVPDNAQYFQENPYAVMTPEEIDVVLKKTTDPVMKSVLNQIDKIYKAHKNDEKIDHMEPDAQFDKIAKPRHYNLGKVECIDAIESALIGYTGFTAYCVGNCIKYLHRSPHKGTQDDDMAKAKWYLDKAIESLKESK